MKNPETRLNYQTFAEGHTPPMDTPFLLWLDSLHNYGGFPAIARRVRGRDGAAYVRYGTDKGGWNVLEKYDMAGARGSPLPPPYIQQAKES